MQTTQTVDSISISKLTELIKGTLEVSFSAVWVHGEVCDLAKPRSGHVYLTLKDGNAQIKAVMWRSVAEKVRFELNDGISLLCFGSIDVYGPRGVYQLVIKKVQPLGVGALQLAFEQLQRKLAAEGLFDPQRKRPLPRFPRRIGFVTSPTGAAARDFIEVARRRWAGSEIIIIPAIVQGNGAARSIVEAIIAGNAISPDLDVLVVGRGGGSMEDLWCFNEEIVVRALAASTVPTVSAVGHEIDVTLSDLAADVRAQTPSAAAEIVIPDRDAISKYVLQLQRRLQQPILSRIQLMKSRLNNVANRPVLRRPFDRVHDLTQRLDELDSRGRRAMTARMEHARSRLSRVATAIEALSPLATLRRGYSVTFVRPSGKVLYSIDDVQQGDKLETRLLDGTIFSQVDQVLFTVTTESVPNTTQTDSSVS